MSRANGREHEDEGEGEGARDCSQPSFDIRRGPFVIERRSSPSPSPRGREARRREGVLAPVFGQRAKGRGRRRFGSPDPGNKGNAGVALPRRRLPRPALWPDRPCAHRASAIIRPPSVTTFERCFVVNGAAVRHRSTIHRILFIECGRSLRLACPTETRCSRGKLVPITSVGQIASRKVELELKIHAEMGMIGGGKRKRRRERERVVGTTFSSWLIEKLARRAEGRNEDKATGDQKQKPPETKRRPKRSIWRNVWNREFG